MRKLLSIFALLVTATTMWSLHIEPTDPTKVCPVYTADRDTIFLFNGNPELRSKIGNVNWWRTLNTDPIQTDAEETSMANSGDRVIVEKDGQVLDVVYVFNYNDYKPTIDADKMYADLTCDQTHIFINGNVPFITYVDTFAQTKTLAHEGVIRYTDLAWDGEQWQDSAASKTFALEQKHVQLPAIACETSFTLTWDATWREALGMEVDSIETTTYTPIAARTKVTTEATVRGTEEENEVDRPIDIKVLSASAPLEVVFHSNPTPAVRFFDWNIYRGSELLANRKDQDVRYTFYEPGNYRAVVTVRSDSCNKENVLDPAPYMDSVQIKTSNSQLLVPNVFTPNGDGKNDEFRVLYTSLREFHIWVYNRWGKLVYESTDPSKGWDGNIGNRPASAGAYYYVVRAMGTDAAKDATYHSRQAYEKGKKENGDEYLGIYQLSGDINLLR